MGYGLTGNTTNLDVLLPPGAQPAPPLQDHLIDKATGQYTWVYSIGYSTDRYRGLR